MSSELESLRAEVEELRKHLAYAQTAYGELISKWQELRAKLASAEKDAERYRWLRDMWWMNTAEKRGMEDIVGFVDTPLEFDTAIDSARGKP